VAGQASSVWEGCSVLVTGAGGFIGSHLVEALVRGGAEVRAFVRYNSRNDYGWLDAIDRDVYSHVEIFRGDLANPEAVAGSIKSRERIVHLGALIPIPYSYRHPREFISTNVVGTLNVLEAARRGGISRLVQVSSSEVYGTPLALPIAESAPLNAQSPYAASKVGADQLALSYSAAFDLPVVIARPFNTFGPRQSARAVIPTIIAAALIEDEIVLGSTAPTRDFLYVDDTVSGLMRCGEVEGVEGDVINLGTGTEISVGDIASLVLRELRIDKPIRVAEERVRPARSEVARLKADVAKASALLDWAPSVSITAGVRRTIEWFAESIERYKPSIYNV
jgi:NAD dependent epimerase/dehydratase